MAKQKPEKSPPDWWKDFFDRDYLAIWGASMPEERSDEEAGALWSLLKLKEGDQILDAPCGYGRLSWRLAKLGGCVLGVDQSETLLARAEEDRHGLDRTRLRFLLQDLRKPLPVSGFDAAVNIFSSLGYGSEKDDCAILSTIRDALRPKGRLFIETNHRDSLAAFLSKGTFPALRLNDGTLVLEEPHLDAVTGRIESTWFWSGPSGAGHKKASIRIYSATELVALIERAGLRFLSAHQGCSPKPFAALGSQMGGRLGLLVERA